MKDVFISIKGKIYDLVLRDSTTTAKTAAEPTTNSTAKKTITDLGQSKPCPDHEGKRLWYKEGQYGKFWSHKNDDGTFHNIKDQSVVEKAKEESQDFSDEEIADDIPF